LSLSSFGLEHSSDTRKVLGSNPRGTTKNIEVQMLVTSC